jgi:hypothetical protein
MYSLLSEFRDGGNMMTTTMSTNRSVILRDPDGGLVNLFHPGHPAGQGEVRPLNHPRAGAARHGRPHRCSCCRAVNTTVRLPQSPPATTDHQRRAHIAADMA